MDRKSGNRPHGQREPTRSSRSVETSWLPSPASHGRTGANCSRLYQTRRRLRQTHQRHQSVCFDVTRRRDSFRRSSGIAENIRNAGGDRRRSIRRCAARRQSTERIGAVIADSCALSCWHAPCSNASAAWSAASVYFALAAPVEHGLPQKAVELGRPFGFPITNSMVVTWIVAVGLIVFAQIATRRMAQVPGGAQNFLEWLIESLYNLLESIIGPHLVQTDVLVLRHDLHLHPRRQLGRAASRSWHHRLGPPDGGRLRRRSTALSRRQRRSQPDAGDGARLLRVLDRLGAAGSRRARHRHRALRPEGRDRPA